MKWKVVFLVLILMSSFAGSKMGSEENCESSLVQYCIPRRGVQEFSDGEIVMVERPVEVSLDDEYCSVLGMSYNCFIKRGLSEGFLTFQKGDALIMYDIPGEQPFGKLNAVEGFCKERGDDQENGMKSFVYEGIFEGMDLRYTFLHHKVLEEIVIEKFRGIQIVQQFSIENVWLSEKEGGIYFYHKKTGRLVFFIPPPVMYEEGNPGVRCYNIHYEVNPAGDKYIIRKVIDKEGLTWLKDPERVYPVVIDSTTEGGISDPWEESGLLPYGQYFKNVNEYVSPTCGSLTVKQTDLYLPGRGMDLVVSRVYTTPQLFTIDDGFQPLEEDPPWKIANGWRFDFPAIADNYLYLWDGRMYKLEWGNDPPECPYWCFPPLEPEEQVFNNHKGDHFRLIKHVDGTYTLYLKDGRVLEFSSSGDIQSITDIHGNQILFSGNTITDTVGRVVTVSASGVSYGQRYVNYTIQYVDYNPLLTGVTDCMGRVTHYYYEHANKWLLTKVVYPTQGYTEYTHAMKERRICNETCHVWNKDCHEVADCYQQMYQFRVVTQKVYADTLVKVRSFTYVEDWENTLESTEKTKDELYYVQSETHFTISNGKIKSRTVTDFNGNQKEKVTYTYNAQGEIILNKYYKGETDEVTYQEFSQYDEWGNQVYSRNSLGYEGYASYYNTSSEGAFTDYSGNVVQLFSNQFYTNSTSDIYNKIAGTCTVQGGSTIETYYLYDSTGNMIESKDIFQGESYLVYYGLFDENGQIVFPFTSDTPTDDAILRIASLPTLNPVLKSETHSVSEHSGYNNTGYWKGKYFWAYWLHGRGLDVEDGFDRVGPFTHYPGTEGYLNYNLWISGRAQYVKTNYRVYENLSPSGCSYRLNDGSWTQITSNLGNGTTQITIPKESVLQDNILEFQESGSYKTRFQWALFIPVQSEPETYYKYFQYDDYGNLVAATNCYGTTLFEYDQGHQSAHLTAVIDPLGNRISCVYDEAGNITSITDGNGCTYHYEYDLLNRLTKKINPDLTEREAVYDDVNNIVTIYDELDHFMKKYFDGLGRITKTEYAGLYTEEYTYNYLGKVETRVNPTGAVYTYEYDILGRVTKSANPDGTFAQWIYNDLENTCEVYDENSNKKEYTYNWTGNLLSVKEYINQSYYLTEYKYDESGNVAEITDAKGNSTVYKYNMFGIERIVYPNMSEEHFTYDCIGNVVQKTHGNKTINYHYNIASQLVEIEYLNSSVTFTYDANGNRVSMVDPVSSTVYVYDPRNRLVSETKTIDGSDYTTSYVYDAASNIVSIIYPDGTVVNQNYDDLNRVTSVEGYAQFSWNESSQLQHIAYQNGVTTNYTYDVRSRPIQIVTAKNGGDLLNLSYIYDATGNILQIEDTPNGQLKEQQDYTYDPLHRLTTAVGGPQGDFYSLSYVYDSTGNRIQLNNTVYTYNEMNELLTQEGNTNCIYTYDEYGNCTTKTDGGTIWEYYYDDETRLLSVKENGQVTEQYVYDGDGKRIKKIGSDSVRIYIYSGLKVLYEMNTATQMDAVYIHGPAGRIAKKVNDITEYYHTDHLGSTRLTTSENGVIVTEVQYKPFGEQVNATEEQYTFTGKELDDTGFYYYGARYYDPETGRFLTRDPLQGERGAPQTLNRYVYCLNNPLKYIDPAGTDPKETVEEIFQRMQNVDPATYAELQKQVDSEAMTALEALKVIMELLGYKIDERSSTDEVLKVIVEGGLVLSFGIDNTIAEWGTIDPETSTIKINFGKSGKVADMALIALHEVCHAVLGGKHGDQHYEHQFIYSVQYSYASALKSIGVEVSEAYRNHLWVEAHQHDRSFFNEVPIPDIVERWFPYIEPVLA